MKPHQKKPAFPSVADEDQAATIAFLESAASYPAPVAQVRRIDTHAAIVFLAGDLAYKLKRAVKLPYLDFRTREARHRTLLHELEINSRISPELYIEVLPITRAPQSGALRVNGAGPAIDWVLVMRRFDDEALFSVLANKGPLACSEVEALADTILAFHRSAAVHKTGRWPQSLAKIVDDLDHTLTADALRSRGLEYAPYISALRTELAAQAPMLAEREGAGSIRRCHGDLHLGNIVLWKGKPTLFDAIEFDDGLATIDVLYDLAFLLMDLWRRGRKQEANAIFNRYFRSAAVSELAALALLPLYFSIRAGIRAMTGVHRHAVANEEARNPIIEEIRDYAALAESFLRPRTARLVAVGGLSGSGKTTAARQIAPFVGAAPGALHLRTDVERKLMHGVALHQPLPPEAYTIEEGERVYKRVFEKAGVALSCGHSVIIDAVFPAPSMRAELLALAQRTSARTSGFWLEASHDQLMVRVAARKGDASDADRKVVMEQLRTICPPVNWIRIDAGGGSGTVASRILQRLASAEVKGS